MPEAIRLKPQQLTSPETLASHLSVEHVDWACDALAIRREWLDFETEQPHHVIPVYKHPEMLYEWLRERANVRGNRPGCIHVFATEAFKEPGVAHGRFAIAYAESFATLDDRDLYRYWWLSQGAHFAHTPCSIDLLAILAVTEHFTLLPSGHVVSHRALCAAEKGLLGLLPLVLDRPKSWSPQDWVPVRYEMEGCKSDTHRRLWLEAGQMLRARGLERVLSFARHGTARDSAH